MPGFEKINHLFEYALIRFLGSLVNFLPFRFVLWLARPVGISLFWCLKKSRRMALENLRQVYGSQKSESEIHKIAQETFVHLAEFGAEWLRIPQIVRNPGRYLAVFHVERLRSALMQKKRGAILLVSHNGNWEIMALIGGWLMARPLGTSIYALARPLKNRYLYQHVLRLRGLMGLKSIAREGGARETFTRLKKNEIVSLLIDQRIREGGIEVEFLGRKALTTSLPAVAARRLGTPVFHVSLHRTPNLRYELEIEGPVPTETTRNPKRDIRVNTQRFVNRIETEILKDPTQWLWMHNRWRARNGPK